MAQTGDVLSNLVTVQVTIRRFDAPEAEWNQLGEQLFAKASSLAGETSLKNTIAQVALFEGSLTGRVGLIGSLLLAAYGATADYKGFKESIAEMEKDGRWVATKIREAIPQIVGEHQPVARTDVSKGRVVVAAEEISKLIEQLEKLKKHSRTMSADDLAADLDGIVRRIRSLRRQLDQADMATLEGYMATEGVPIPSRGKLPAPSAGQDVLRPDLFEELRQRLEETGRLERPLGMSLPDAAVERARSRRRRRMYFKRASVQGTEQNPKLL
jgi:hypothetical protein